MEFEVEGNILVAKLDHDADFFDSVENIMDESGYESAVVVSAIGMLKNFNLGFYNGNKGSYEWKEYQDPMELVEVKGSISKDGTMHFHAAVAGRDHGLEGGHLESGEVYNVVELTMLVFDDMQLDRELDEDRDMELLSLV